MKKQAEEIIEKQGIVKKVDNFRTYFEQSKLELKKVIWPSKEETITTSSAVLLLVVVMAVFLGLVDFSLTKIISAILS